MTMTWTTTTTLPAMMINNKGDNQQENEYRKPLATCDGVETRVEGQQAMGHFVHLPVTDVRERPAPTLVTLD